MTEQSNIPAPTPGDDVIPYQERVEFVADQRIAEAVGLLDAKYASVTESRRLLAGSGYQTLIEFMHDNEYGHGVSSPPLAVPAGGSIYVQQYDVDDEGVYHYEDLRIQILVAKVADENGIPISPVSPGVKNLDRVNGVIALPAVAGYTLDKYADAGKDYYVGLTPAAAGWYCITAALLSLP